MTSNALVNLLTDLDWVGSNAALAIAVTAVVLLVTVTVASWPTA